MLVRFCLYGFLKNQRYFEPFLILALLDRGLSFFEIGLLITIRELAVNLLEVPSGAIADVCGRRGSMVLAFVAYIVSFVVLGLATHFGVFAVAMLLFAVGETFRSGTHKAMIFAWLARHGRSDERTRVYGLTRSWSKFGSATSVVIATALVLSTEQYADVFFYSTVPYVLAIINLATYPSNLEPERSGRRGLRPIWDHLRSALRDSAGAPRLRRLMGESMAFDGVFQAVGVYVQPIIQIAALASLGFADGMRDLSETQRTALLVGAVYVTLHVLAGFASRSTHRLSARCGGDEPATGLVWLVAAMCYATLLVGGLLGTPLLLLAGFVALHAVQNLWRPLLISRISSEVDAHRQATVLSIESQSRRLATMVLAPTIGLAIDRLGQGEQAEAFWPIGATGLALALVVLLLWPRRGTQSVAGRSGARDDSDG